MPEISIESQRREIVDLKDRIMELEKALDDTTTALEMVTKNADFPTIYDEILVARKIMSSRDLLEKKEGGR